MLANILLHQLDRELEWRGHRFARYADDLIVLVKSKRAGERVMRSITRYLQTTLKLKVNPAKSKVAAMGECSFLGFTIKGKKIRWTDKALANFKHRVTELTGRSWGVSMDHRLHKLGQYLRGWFGYFGISEYYRPVGKGALTGCWAERGAGHIHRRRRCSMLISVARPNRTASSPR